MKNSLILDRTLVRFFVINNKEKRLNIEIIPVTAFQQNCSLIWDDEKNAAIIDPGGNSEKLIQRIEELELNLKAVLLTHGHLDHVGAAEAIRDHFNIEIWGSQEEDRFLFESLPQQAQQFGLPYISAFTPDRWFNQEGEKIQIGTFTFEILHLPGHTPGHIGFIEHEKKYCFYWRCPFPKQYWSYRLPSWRF